MNKLDKINIANVWSDISGSQGKYIIMNQFNQITDLALDDIGLKQIPKTIQSLLRQTDVLARLGGDEFAILLDSCSLYQAKNICNQIIKKIKDTRFNWGKNSFETGASIGIVPITKLTVSASEVMSTVDAACYEAKDKGRNRIQVFVWHQRFYIR